MNKKKPLDTVTIRKRLDSAMAVPVDAIAHVEEVNNLKQDAGKRSFLLGDITRKFVMTGLDGIKKSKIKVDFRPACDTMERFDFFFDIRLIRNGVQVDRKIIKETKIGKVRANSNNILEFVLTNKKTLTDKAIIEGDVITVTFKSEHPQVNKVYFANMYITKE